MITQKRSWLRDKVASFAFRFGLDRLALFALGIRVDGQPAWRARIYRSFEDDDSLVLSYVFPPAPHTEPAEDEPVDLSDPRVQ